MRHLRFSKEQRVVMGEREYEIEQRLPNGDLQLKDIVTNTYITRPEEELVRTLFNGDLSMITNEQRTPYVSKKAASLLKADFAQLPEGDRNKAKRKHAYVSRIIEEGLDKRTQESLKPLIETVSKEIGDAKPPSWIQVYRWYRRFMKSGENIRSLLDLHRGKGNGERKISQEVIDIIDHSIKEAFLIEQRLTVQSVHDIVIARIAHENSFRDPEDKIKVPSYWAPYRAINKLDQYEVMKARYGKRIADLKYRPKKQGVRPTRPLERVEIDHTKLDLFVVDHERRMPIGRPWLTTAIDVYTKSIVGMYVSFNPPSYLSVMQCLLHAILPKTYVRERYPEIRHEWNAYGIMETAVVDNGKEFHSSHFEDACLQLGIVVQYAPVKLAWYKPSIERYFGTLNTRLLHAQPGTSFSNIFDKADYDSRKNAIIDFDTLMEVIHKWIADVYHYDKHRGIQDIPALVWKKAIEVFPPALPPNNKELEVLLGMIEERVISAAGIELHGLFYNDDSLAALRRRKRGEGKEKVKYNPNDLSLIHVFDRDALAFIPVAAVDQNYTKGLTLWQHNVIKRYTREYLRKNCDIVSLALAKEEIQKIVEESWRTSKKTGSRQKAARWKNIAQEGYGQIEPLHGGSINQLEEPAHDGPPNSFAFSHPMCSISDLGVPIVDIGDVGGQKNPIYSESELGIATRSVAKNKKPGTQGQRKKKAGNKGLETGAKPELLCKMTRTSDEDSELDMTGWAANYSLPKQGE